MCNCNRPTIPTRQNRSISSRQIVRFTPSQPPIPVEIGFAPNQESNIGNGGEPIGAERRKIEALKRKAAIQKHLGR